ncbi:uncharacterized protein A4U43_C08F29660 [Asparagus officinalis]|uniref:uncharacterized protein LOC109822518 n=1 Tax=Asparagus officinalis TaxID=4686 RepID=UPI00098E2F03|nr:uncharacterized protein LOC109822518 [Asparagus officinalis]ONK61414.1 uncharacterized protein A4U43_C08F29660 [Asparagus officinalis]
MAMAPHQNLALMLLLLSLYATVSNSQNAFPTQHGLMYEKNPAESSAQMVGFFGQPKVEMPEARDPRLSSSAGTSGGEAEAVTDTDVGHSGGHRKSGVVIAGIVFAVVGVALVATGLVAYVVKARKPQESSSSGTGFVSLAQWRTYPEVL